MDILYLLQHDYMIMFSMVYDSVVIATLHTIYDCDDTDVSRIYNLMILVHN